MSKAKTKRMRFHEDMYYNLDVIYTKGQVADVPEEMVARWLRRGAELVGETPTIVEPKPVVKEEPKLSAPVKSEWPKPEVKDEVELEVKKAEDGFKVTKPELKKSDKKSK